MTKRKKSRLDSVMSSADDQGRDDWCTPKPVLDAVRRVGPIMLDPCSNPQSIVGARVSWELPIDGLAGDWLHHSKRGLVFTNPPYGRDASGDWIGKCAFEGRRGTEIIGLVPSRTDTIWFHDEILDSAAAICFWRRRIPFLIDGKPAPAGATFPSILPYWGEQVARFARAFEGHGKVWRLRRGR